MIIAVGATSEIKTAAAEETVKTLFPEAQVLLLNMGVEEQLFGFDQLTQGANAKARQALDLQKADVGVGIEKALVKIESSGANSNGWFDFICVAALTADGKTAMGFGLGFFIPEWVVTEIKEQKEKLSTIIARLSNGSDQDALAYFSNHLLAREGELQSTILAALSKLINEGRYHL